MNRSFALLALATLAGCDEPASAPTPAQKIAPPAVAASRAAAASGSLRADSARFAYGIFFLPAPTSDPEQALRKRCARPAAAFADRATLSVRRSDATNFRDTAPELLDLGSVDLTIADRKALRRSEPALVLSMSARAPLVAQTLHHADDLAGCIARATGGVVYDYSTRQIFSADAWQRRRIATWHGDVPDAPAHFIIHEYPHGEMFREVSLGMEKLALPDLEVVEVPRNLADPMAHVINLVAQALAQNPTATPSGTVIVDGKTRVEVPLGWSRTQEGDADNRLVAVRFDAPKAGTAQEQQVALIDRIVGIVRDSVVRGDHDAELLAASARARKRLAAFKPAVQHGLRPDEELLVKAPFEASNGVTEWMWIDVTSWEGETIRGVLDSDPVDVKNLRPGARVSVEESSVFDYLFKHGDEHEGNETGELLQARQRR